MANKRYNRVCGGRGLAGRALRVKWWKEIDALRGQGRLRHVVAVNDLQGFLDGRDPRHRPGAGIICGRRNELHFERWEVLVVRVDGEIGDQFFDVNDIRRRTEGRADEQEERGQGGKEKEVKLHFAVLGLA